MVSINLAKSFTLATVLDKPNMMVDRDTSDVCETELSGFTEPLGSDGYDARDVAVVFTYVAGLVLNHTDTVMIVLFTPLEVKD